MIYRKPEDLPDRRVSHNPEIGKKVMLDRGDLPCLLNFSRAVFGPGQTAAAHSHEDMNEVFFVENGRGVIRIDGQAYPLGKGVCAAIETGEIHEISNTGDTDLVLLYFAITESLR